MLTRTFTAFVLATTPQAPAPPWALAGPPVEARWSGAIAPASTAEAPLRVVADVPLPGSASRFDYQSLEPASGRLFISHMGAGQLVVFDVRAGRVIANLDGFPSVTGVLAVPVEHRAYAAATGDHVVVVVDDSTFRIVARVPGPRFPDGIAYAPEERRVFVAGETGRGGFLNSGTNNSPLGPNARAGEGGGPPPTPRPARVCLCGAAARPPAGGPQRPPPAGAPPPPHRVSLPLGDVSGRPVLRVLVPSDSR